MDVQENNMPIPLDSSNKLQQQNSDCPKSTSSISSRGHHIISIPYSDLQLI